jgi:hypothetical protein
MDKILEKDKIILRELAKQIAEIAALPVQKETIRLWKALNALKPERPMITIDEIPWCEMNVNDELTLQCEHEFCCKIEQNLRRTLYLWKHMRVDMVVEPFIEIPKVIKGKDLGISICEETAITDANNEIVGHSYIDQLKTEEDLEKLKIPHVYLDEAATKKNEEIAHEIFDGIIDIRMQGYFPSFPAWDDIAQLRSVSTILYDLIDRPEFLHKIISKYTEVKLALLDQLESKGLLGYGQNLIHCSGAFSDELPAPGFDPESPRAKDLWTYGMAQMFATVSPAMHEEFELEYANKWFSRFGLVNYGCCEPLENKMEMVRKMLNIRKVSMSPWVNVEKAAQEIGKDYVFSRKPSPSFLAMESWDPESSYNDMRNTLEICSKYGCPTEFILKDISTVRYQPQRIWEWADRAMEIVKG